MIPGASTLLRADPPPVGGGGYLVGAVAECNSAETITIAAPSGSASGDLLILVLFQDAQRLLTVPAGWTERHRVTQSFGSDRQIYMAERVADGTGADSPTITHGSASDRALIISFASGATVLDSQADNYGPSSNPPSNDGTMSGGAGDFVIWGQTCQTGVTSISGFPTPTDDSVGPTAYGTEEFAVGVATLTAPITTGAWANAAADIRYLTCCLSATP